MISYCVYWLHLPEHTDYNTQGYIGITSNFSSRMRTHSKANKNTILSSAIKKYGWDNIVKEILVDGLDKELALLSEEMLRPSTLIGWNIAIGGGLSTFVRGSKHTELAKAKMKGHVFSDSHKALLSQAKKGKMSGSANPSFKGVITAKHIVSGEEIQLSGELDMRSKGFTPQNVYNCVSGARATYKDYTFNRRK